MGKDLRTRSFFRRDIERIITSKKSEIELDFSEVNFISRSVADELYNILSEYPLVKVSGLTNDVEMMFKVVSKGRREPRVYSPVNARIYHLKTMEEMSAFFSAL